MRQSLSQFLLLLVFSLPAAAGDVAAPAGPEVTLPGTETRTLYSEIVGQEYRLQISLPRGYRDSDARYPVLYVLDAQWDFPLLYAIYGHQYYDGFVPGVIVVGILWGGEAPDPDRLRRRDFTPTDEQGDGASGGASAFLSFFDKELIPFVERQYRASGSRTLEGSSLGGLFTLYALFSRPDLFDNYIATSPATPWDGGVIYAAAEGFAARSAESPSRLFVAAAELEDLYGPVMQLVVFLRERDFPGLTWTSHVVGGAGHSGVKPDGVTRGLQFAFERPDLELTAQQLAPLVGDYRSADGKTDVQVQARDGRLWGVLPATGEERELRASDPRHFYRLGEFLNVEFVEDESGTVSGFRVEMFQGAAEFRRVEPGAAPESGPQ